MRKKWPLHIKIFVGMAISVVWSIVSIYLGFAEFTTLWIKPFGIIFINLLKVVAVPLVLVTIIGGIASLKDVSRLAKIGSRTLGWFVSLTLISASIGLIICLIISPGKKLPETNREELKQKYANEISNKSQAAAEVKGSGPLKILQDLVPENFFSSLTNNRNMLQIIFFSVLFGVAIVLTPQEKTTSLRDFISSTNDVLINLVHLIMRFAPYGVGALLAGLVADLAGENPLAAVQLFGTLGLFALSVIAAILILMGVVYPVVLRVWARMNYTTFLKHLIPAQLVAFSTSSSAATLPVTLECTEKNLKVPTEISGFVLPLGITINMHGTAIHQAVSAVFIAQAFGHDLSLIQYFIIVITASLGAMGAPAVPGAGLIMLVMVLSAIGVEEAGLALILAIDRPLDMLRTIPNVVGDALVAMVVNRSVNKVDYT